MIGFSPTPVTSVRFGGMNFDDRHALPPLTGRRACPHGCCWVSAAPILPGEAPITADGLRVNELVSSLKGTLDRFAFQLNAVADGAPTRPSQPHVLATPVSWLLAPRHRTIGVNSGVGRHACGSGCRSGRDSLPSRPTSRAAAADVVNAADDHRTALQGGGQRPCRSRAHQTARC
jgi:hypothetical protein